MKHTNKPVDEIVFDDDAYTNKSPFEMTKKQIWYKAFQRCFDEGSKQLDTYMDEKGKTVDQMQIFFNSIDMFHTMALGVLLEPRHEDIFIKITALDSAIKEIQKEKKESIGRLIDEAKKPNSKININAAMQMIEHETTNRYYTKFWLIAA